MVFFITSFILLKTRPQVKNNFKLHLRGKPLPIPIICQILIFWKKMYKTLDNFQYFFNPEKLF